MSEPSSEEQFAAFMRASSGALWRAAWALSGNASTADDLTQAGLVATWQHWHSIRGSENREAYAYRSMVNAYRHDRRRRWSGEMPAGDLTDVEEPAVFTDGQVESRETVRAALMQLPPRQRSVVVLRYLADLSERTVAEVLGCSVGAVKSHASKGIRALRESPVLQSTLRQGADDE